MGIQICSGTKQLRHGFVTFREWLNWVNHLYDAIPEPTRLFTLIAIAFPGIFMMSFHDNIGLMICGLFWLVALIVTRVLYIEGKL